MERLAVDIEAASEPSRHRSMSQDAAFARDEQPNPEPLVTATTEAPAPVPKTGAAYPAYETSPVIPVDEAAPGPSSRAVSTDTRGQSVERHTQTPQRDDPICRDNPHGGIREFQVPHLLQVSLVAP